MQGLIVFSGGPVFTFGDTLLIFIRIDGGIAVAYEMIHNLKEQE